MNKEILYTTALDDNGDLIHVNEAVKDMTYYCPSCKGELSLKKSGNTGKGSKRPHFAHKILTQNCTAEGVLHYSFKRNLAELLNSFLSEKKGLTVHWNCAACSEQNEANLLAIVISVRVEYNLKVCQPDIALLDTDDNVIAVIEVVVTHSPEEKVLQFYKDSGIILIQIDLSSDEDLKNIEKIVSNPDIIDYCLSPTCLDHKRYSISRRIFSYPDKCGKCLSPIERYAIEVDSTFGISRTLAFTDDEINFLKSKRRNIKDLPDPLTNGKYLISDCINCKRTRLRYGRRGPL